MRTSFQGHNRRQVDYNLFYLREHGLVDLRFTKLLDGSIPVSAASITAKGIDFISDDGGLSSVLGVVTVKLHEDTIKALLIQKVSAAAGDDSVKASLVAKIKETPAEALGILTERLLDAGLDQIPDILTTLGNWLGS